jgi:hypothetical protein
VQERSTPDGALGCLGIALLPITLPAMAGLAIADLIASKRPGDRRAGIAAFAGIGLIAASVLWLPTWAVGVLLVVNVAFLAGVAIAARRAMRRR